MGGAQSTRAEEFGDPWWSPPQREVATEGTPPDDPRNSPPPVADALQSVLRQIEHLKSELSTQREEQQERRQLWPAEEEPARSREALNCEMSAERRQELDVLRAQLSEQREMRHRKIAAITSEVDKLRKELAAERSERMKLQSRHESQDTLQKRNEQLVAALEIANSERSSLRSELERCKEDVASMTLEREETRTQVEALKEVAAISKKMLSVREAQVQDMREKLTAIQEKLGGEATSTTISALRAEYEKQITNIRDLKQLYEHRSKILEQEKATLTTALEGQTATVQELEEKVAKLETGMAARGEALEEMELQLGDSVAECRELTRQMGKINNLFTQMLLGPLGRLGPPEPDLDRLVSLLHENHDLIADITNKGDGSDIAPVLPRLIVDLITQVEKERQEDAEVEDVPEAVQAGIAEISMVGNTDANPEDVPEACISGEGEPNEDVNQERPKAELVNEIASNLPKVWAVLMELLSQQAAHGSRRGSVGDCYTSVNTPGGPRKVISVSKTYIRLKDLIVEKRALQRELGRLKQLNGHLETRLDEQESRLSTVSSELHKTWGLVSRLQAQHRQLHTHEKILRYELHQKRELLSELKQELEYCREKWESARQKNSQTDREWRVLRREFASRKAQDLDANNNSGESGLGEESGEDDVDSSPSESSGSPSPAPCLDAVARSGADSPVALETQVVVHLDVQVPVQDTQCQEIPVVESVEEAEPVQNSGPLLFSNFDFSTLDFGSDVSNSLNAQSTDTPLHQAGDTSVRAEATEEGKDSIAKTEASSMSSTIDVHSEETKASMPETEVSLTPSRTEAPSEKTNESMPETSRTGAPSEEVAEDVSVENRGVVPVSDSTTAFEQRELPVEPPLPERPETPAAQSLDEQDSTCEVDRSNLLSDSSPSPTKEQEIDLVPVVPRIKKDSSLPPEKKCEAGASLAAPAPSADLSSGSTEAVAPPRKVDTRTPEEILAARAERLKRLEEQCSSLYKKVSRTSHISNVLSNRLEELHEQYGADTPSASTPPQPPPLPPAPTPAHRGRGRYSARRAPRNDSMSAEPPPENQEKP